LAVPEAWVYLLRCADGSLYTGWTIDLDAHHETTIGGYLSEELGRVPRPGEEIELHGLRFEVRDVEGTLVTALAVVPDRSRRQDRDAAPARDGDDD